jgi:hypothetical protein
VGRHRRGRCPLTQGQRQVDRDSGRGTVRRHWARYRDRPEVLRQGTAWCRNLRVRAAGSGTGECRFGGPRGHIEARQDAEGASPLLAGRSSPLGGERRRRRHRFARRTAPLWRCDRQRLRRPPDRRSKAGATDPRRMVIDACDTSPWQTGVTIGRISDACEARGARAPLPRGSPWAPSENDLGRADTGRPSSCTGATGGGVGREAPSPLARTVPSHKHNRLEARSRRSGTCVLPSNVRTAPVVRRVSAQDGPVQTPPRTMTAESARTPHRPKHLGCSSGPPTRDNTSERSNSLTLTTQSEETDARRILADDNARRSPRLDASCRRRLPYGGHHDSSNLTPG